MKLIYAQAKRGQRLHLVAEQYPGQYPGWSLSTLCGRSVEHWRLTCKVPVGHACKRCLKIASKKELVLPTIQIFSTELSRQRAAQAWCTPETSGKEMDVELAEAFAAILDEIWSKPWLGNATTGELIEELKARSNLGYRTIDDTQSEVTPMTTAKIYCALCRKETEQIVECRDGVYAFTCPECRDKQASERRGRIP